MSAEPAASPAPKRPRRRRRIIVIVLALFLGTLIGGYMFGRAWLVRNRVIAALESVGLQVSQLRVTNVTPWRAQIEDLVAGPSGELRIEKISISYSPRLLFSRSVDRIAITGVDVNASIMDVIQVHSAGSESRSEARSFSMIELGHSKVRFGETEIPVRGNVVHNRDHVRVKLWMEVQPKPIMLSVAVSKDGFAGSVDSDAIDLQLLAAVLRGSDIHSPRMSGWIGARVAVAMLKGEGSIVATLRPEAISILSEEQSQFNVEGGVITIQRGLGANKSPAQIKIDNVNASSSTSDVWAQSIAGTIVVEGFSPFVTPPDQRINAVKLTSGKVKLTDGVLTFHGKEDGEVLIRQTRWNGMGGEVTVENAVIRPADGSADLTVVAKDLALRDLLDAFARGKATGEGRVDATLPVRVQQSRIVLGEGAAVAEPGGFIQIMDAKPIVQTIASADPRFAEGGQYAELRQDLPRALADFEFQTLRADLASGDNGIRAHVRLEGRGRLTQTRPYNLEFRIDHLNEVLFAGLGLYRILQGN